MLVITLDGKWRYNRLMTWACLCFTEVCVDSQEVRCHYFVTTIVSHKHLPKTIISSYKWFLISIYPSVHPFVLVDIYMCSLILSLSIRSKWMRNKSTQTSSCYSTNPMSIQKSLMTVSIQQLINIQTSFCAVYKTRPPSHKFSSGSGIRFDFYRLSQSAV